MKSFMTILLFFMFGLTLCLLLSTTARAQYPPNYGVQVGFGSSVGTTIPRGDTMFVGGEFDYVGFYTGSMVTANMTTGAVDKVFVNGNNYVRSPNTFPVVNGAIRVMISDGSGGFYIGGDFTRIEDYPRNGLAHIRSDKTLDPAWNINTNDGGKVYSLLLSPDGQTLWVGGDFTSLGGFNKNAIAAVSVSSRSVINSWGPGLVTQNTWTPATVSAITYFPGNAGDATPKLFIGGDFSGFNWSVTKANLAALNPLNGTVYSGWKADITPFTSTMTGIVVTPIVRTLLVTGNDLAIGGIFSSVTTNDNLVNNLHCFAGVYLNSNTTLKTTNVNFGNRIYPKDETSVVNCLKIINNEAGVPHLGIGGRFKLDHNASPHQGFVLTDLPSGAIRRYTPSGPLVNAGIVDTTYTPGVYSPGEVYNFEVTGSTVILVGDFVGAYGNEATVKVRRNVARMDMRDCIIQDWFPYYMQTRMPVRGLAVTGGKILLVGHFTSAGGTLRRNIAAVNLKTSAILPLNPKPDSYVNDFEFSVTKDTLYLAGNFTSFAGPVNRGYTAAIDIRTNTLLPWSTTSAAGGGVEDIIIDYQRNLMFAGGKFNTMGGLSRSHLAALNSRTGAMITNWTADVTTINGQITPVRSMALSVTGDTLYVGGRYNTIAGNTRANLAAFSVKPTTSPVGATATILPWDFPVTNVADIGVCALLLDRGRLYVGGKYTSIKGNTTLNNLSAINITANDLETSWNPMVRDGGGGVWCMQAVDDKLYIGGDFGTIGGVETSFAGLITISDASVVSGWKPYPHVLPFGGVNLTLFVHRSYVYLGGSQLHMRQGIHDAIFHISTIPAFDFIAPLPVKLTYFNATSVGKTVLVQWNGTGETSEYTLERSLDGVTFVPIGTFQQLSASYTDRDIAAGKTYYYRLAINDNGRDTYSAVRRVIIKTNNNSLPVWMLDNSTMRVITPSGDYQLQVYNNSGQELIRTALKQGANDVKLRVSTGIYYYLLQKDGKTETGKLFVH